MISYAMYLYQNAFVFLKMGYASAMAWVLFLLTLAITLVLLWSSKKWVHYGSDATDPRPIGGARRARRGAAPRAPPLATSRSGCSRWRSSSRSCRC